MSGFHCEHEHHDHGHSREGSHGHSHEPPVETNAQQSLFPYIDTSKLQLLNGIKSHSSPCISDSFIKSLAEKYDTSRYIQSDADCQVLIQIPFTASVRIFCLLLRLNENSKGFSTPRHIEIYKNYSKNLDFDTITDVKPDFLFEYPDSVGVSPQFSGGELRNDDTFTKIDLPRNVFQNCENITVLLRDNWSGDEDDMNRIYYCEIRGEATGSLKSNAVPIMTVYEAAPNPVHAKLESEVVDYNL